MDLNIILTSAVAAAIVSGLINHYSKIKAIRESGLYSEKVKVHDEMMEKLAVLDLAILDFTALITVENKKDNQKIRATKVYVALNDLESLMSKKSHYFKQKTVVSIKDIFSKYKKVYIVFLLWNNKENIRNHESRIIKSKDLYIEEIRPHKEDIAKEFRKLMNIENIFEIMWFKVKNKITKK